MKTFRRDLLFIISVILILGCCSLNACTLIQKDNIPDFVLDGDKNGIYPMIGKYMPPAKNDQLTDDYRYLGFASFINEEADETFEVSNYRYLVMTYTGDITQLRFEFAKIGTEEDGSDSEMQGPFWFNPESQDGNCFVTADGSDIPLTGNNTTIVIDLKESGVDMSRYNSGIDMHCDSMLTYGNGEGIIILDAYLTNISPK